MAFVPMLFPSFWDDLEHPHRLFDQDFGLGLRNDQLLCPYRDHSGRNRIGYAPQYSNQLMRSGGTSTVQTDKDKYTVVLDVQQFKPEEISVKVADKYVTIEGKHEEKKDEHGWISRQFSRRYLIPDECDMDKVSSSLSSDGVLSITVMRKPAPQVGNERSIRIEHTGKPAIQEKETGRTIENKNAKK